LPESPPGAGPRLPPLRDVIARYGLDARKGLGQHFLLDLNLTRRIARAAGDLGRGTTIEIGPGPGGLTRALLELGARKVLAIERDVRCVAALSELAAAYPGRLEIVAGDALEIDAAALGTAPRRIVANLPYNISTPLLTRWLAQAAAYESMTLMFQREVAERLAATARSKDYGRLSVLTQWLCDVALLFDVAKEAFVPPPKITSTVVRLTPRPTPLAAAEHSALETVTAAAFGQRRKMLRSSLKRLGVDAGALLALAGIEESRRAEEIDVAGFCAMARAYAQLKERASAGS
jgi:16S rRNA (adenine1518-N6/adenine1519-N6)-dimethyltransferase